MIKQYRKLWIALVIIVILCPLGLIATGTAFGEWSQEELQEEFGYVPQGLQQWADTYSGSVLPDYSIPVEDASTMVSVGGYMLSAIIGVALVIGIMALFYKVVED